MDFLGTYITDYIDLTVDISENFEEIVDEMEEFELSEGILVE